MSGDHWSKGIEVLSFRAIVGGIFRNHGRSLAAVAEKSDKVDLSESA